MVARVYNEARETEKETEVMFYAKQYVLYSYFGHLFLQ